MVSWPETNTHGSILTGAAVRPTLPSPSGCARWNRRLRNASPHKGVRKSPIYSGIKRRDRRMLDEIVLDHALLEGRLRSLGAEARRVLRATPPARGRGTIRQPGATARRGVLTLANNSPILYIHCAYGNGRFQDASFPVRGAFRQAVEGFRREESHRGRVAARHHRPRRELA
jgi:hypothetical protein